MSNRDQEDGSVSRALALQLGGLKFRSQHPHKKSGTAAWGEVETALLGPAGCQPSCRVSERPCLRGIRKGVCDRVRDTQSPPLAPLVHTHMCESTHTLTCAHTHTHIPLSYKRKSIQSTLRTHTTTCKGRLNRCSLWQENSGLYWITSNRCALRSMWHTIQSATQL